MKKPIVLSFALLYVLLHLSHAQPVPQTEPDTVWTKLLWNLGSDIYKVQFTPDGNSIAVAIGDGVYIYDVHT